MRCKLTILFLLALAAVFVSIASLPAGGDCESGIKAVHLDTTPGAFVDDETIEIDDTNGLQVKAIPDNSVTTAKISDGAVTGSKVDSIFGSWTDKDSENDTLVKGEKYKVTSDGFIHLHDVSPDWDLSLTVYDTDGSSVLLSFTESRHGYAVVGCIPIKKNCYFKGGGNQLSDIYWMPIGSGTCVKQ